MRVTMTLTGNSPLLMHGAPPAVGPAPEVSPDTPLGGGPIGATTWQAETDPQASPLEQVADALRQKAAQERPEPDEPIKDEIQF